MPNDTLAHPMTGWEKRDAVDAAIKVGDASAANSVLNTVQDQKLFMDLLASKVEGEHLPGLQLSTDATGHTHQIKTDKMVISDASGHLNAEATHTSVGQYIQTKWDGLSNFFSGVSDSVKDAAGKTELGDALKKSGTSESLLNQNIDNKIRQAGG